jgi:predicted RNA-binding Zn ribbon-like protein
MTGDDAAVGRRHDGSAGVAAPGEAAHPALALANSRRGGPGGPTEDLASAGALRAWLAAHALPAEGVDRAALAAMRELRDAVRELLLARIDRRTPDPGALATVNAAAAAAPMAPRLEWGTEPRAARAAGAEGIVLARALLAVDAIELVSGAEHADLRACSAPGCVRVLLKDHPRRHWCSTRCGDRVRASRYYHRHHPAKGTRV